MMTVSGLALAAALARLPADKRREVDAILAGEDAMSLSLLTRIGGFHALSGATSAMTRDPGLGRILAQALEPVTERIVSQAKHGHPGPGRSESRSLRDCPLNLIAPTMAQARDTALRQGRCDLFEELAGLIARDADRENLASIVEAALRERQAA